MSPPGERPPLTAGTRPEGRRLTRPGGRLSPVWAIVRTVPEGRVTTYAEVAEAHFGRRGGARAVGRAMRLCPDDVPWWRVVRADGRLPDIAARAEHRARLEEEGVRLVDGGTRVNWRTLGGPWSPPSVGTEPEEHRMPFRPRGVEPDLSAEQTPRPPGSPPPGGGAGRAR